MVDEFLDALPVKARAKLEKWMQLLEERGPDLPRPYADVLRDKIRELRVKFGNTHYRLLYFFVGKKIIMTHGFVKKTEAVPEIEVRFAIQAMKDFLQRLETGTIEI